MQELASYKTAIDANADKAFLESRGIEVHIQNERVADANPILGLAIGVKLLIKETNLERARQLLNENRT
jgi:hypothetical protein